MVLDVLTQFIDLFEVRTSICTMHNAHVRQQSREQFLVYDDSGQFLVNPNPNPIQSWMNLGSFIHDLFVRENFFLSNRTVALNNDIWPLIIYNHNLSIIIHLFLSWAVSEIRYCVVLECIQIAKNKHEFSAVCRNVESIARTIDGYVQ